MFTIVNRVVNWFKGLFGRELLISSHAYHEIERFERAYKDISDVNVIAAVAKRLANIITADCTVQVIGESAEESNPRSEFLDESIQHIIRKLNTVSTRTMATGGVVLKPWKFGPRLYADIIPQSRFYVLEQKGDIIISAGFRADTAVIKTKRYELFEEHTLSENGDYTIRIKAARENGEEVALGVVPEWADFLPEQTIKNVDKMLFAFLKCPTDPRKSSNHAYGVPVTYGNDKLICEIVELLNMMQREYKNKEAFIGADSILFKRDKNGKEQLPDTGVYKTFRAAGGVDEKPFWEVFSPEIRGQSYIAAIDYKLGLLEKMIGVNQGVLTNMQSAEATATAIKRSSFDTFSLVDSMRKNLEEAIDQLVYAFDVYANAGELAPLGVYSLSYDWDYSLLEDPAERWAQLKDGQAMGVVRPEEPRMFLFDETLNEALANLPETEQLLRAE